MDISSAHTLCHRVTLIRLSPLESTRFFSPPLSFVPRCPFSPILYCLAHFLSVSQHVEQLTHDTQQQSYHQHTTSTFLLPVFS